jgi:CubicO group peptidase (beta-lactamase class C family)
MKTFSRLALGIALVVAVAAVVRAGSAASPSSSRALEALPPRPGAPFPLPAALPALDQIVTRGIRSGIYPGAVLLVGSSTQVLYARGYGPHTWSPSSPVPRPDSTLWDLASLTKVVGTASAAARLVDEGRLELDTPVQRYLPEFRGPGKEAVTVRMLLDHTSGLPAFEKIWRRTSTRAEATRRVLAEPLKRVPGEQAVYSDFNSMVLGLVIERAAGEPLDQVMERTVFGPLGMRQTLFNPPSKLYRRIMPTGVFRGSPSAGRVHDKNATVLGGVSGHAGLFASGEDLGLLAQAWLREGRMSSGEPWLSTPVVRRFLQTSSAAGSRRLGWDGRDSVPLGEDGLSIFGRATSSQVFGHTGWTGTMLWIDPPRDLFVVLLTNRTFNPRAADPRVALRAVRADLADAIVGWSDLAGRPRPQP